MIGKTIAAYTGPTPDIGFVAYINITEAYVGVKISIRSASEDGQEYAHIVMPKGEAEKLFAEALSRPPPVDGELVERIAKTIGQSIVQLGLEVKLCEVLSTDELTNIAQSIAALSQPTDARKVIEDCIEALGQAESVISKSRDAGFSMAPSARPISDDDCRIWIEKHRGKAIAAAKAYLGEK